MHDLLTFFEMLSLTPVPVILVAAGAGFLYLAIGKQFQAHIAAATVKQRYAGLAGITLLLVGIGLLVGPGMAVVFAPAPEPTPEPTEMPPAVYLADLKPLTSSVGFMTFSTGTYNFTSPDRSDHIAQGDPLIAHGIQYPHGLYAHAPSQLTYRLNGKFSEFSATLTMVDWIACGDGAVFVIKLDGAEIFRSQRMASSSDPENIKVKVTGGKLLELMTEPVNTKECDWAIWGVPLLRRSSWMGDKSVNEMPYHR